MRKILLSILFSLLLLSGIGFSTDWFYYGQYSEHFDDGVAHFGGFSGMSPFSSTDLYYDGGIYKYNEYYNIYNANGPNISSISNDVEFILLRLHATGTDEHDYSFHEECIGGTSYGFNILHGDSNIAYKNMCDNIDHIRMYQHAGHGSATVKMYDLQYLNDYGEPINGVWYPYSMQKVIYDHINFDDEPGFLTRAYVGSSSILQKIISFFTSIFRH